MPLSMPPVGAPLFASLGGLLLTLIGLSVRAEIPKPQRYVYVSALMVPVFLLLTLMVQNQTVRKSLYVVAIGITLAALPHPSYESGADSSDDQEKAGGALTFLGVIVAWLGHTVLGQFKEKQATFFSGLVNLASWVAILMAFLGAILFWAHGDDKSDEGSILLGYWVAIVAIVFLFASFLEDRVMGWVAAFLAGLFWPTVFARSVVDDAEGTIVAAGVFSWLAFLAFVFLLQYRVEGAGIAGMFENFKKSLTVHLGIPMWGLIGCVAVFILGASLAEADSEVQEWLLAASFFSLAALLVSVLQTGDRRHILVLVSTGLFLGVIGIYLIVPGFGVIFNAHIYDVQDESQQAGGYALVALALVVAYVLQAPFERIRTTFAGCAEFKRLGFGLFVLGIVAFNAVGVFLLWSYGDENDSSGDINAASVILFSSIFFLVSVLVVPFESALYANLVWNALIQVAWFSLMLEVDNGGAKKKDTGMTGYLFAWIAHVLFAIAVVFKLYWSDGGEGAAAATGEGATATGEDAGVPAAAPTTTTAAAGVSEEAPRQPAESSSQRLAEPSEGSAAGNPELRGDLPSGWEQHENEQGIPYFFNVETGETRWEPPV